MLRSRTQLRTRFGPTPHIRTDSFTLRTDQAAGRRQGSKSGGGVAAGSASRARATRARGGGSREAARRSLGSDS
eukprot:505518-Alexandrium_andersonii.AAC.1